MPAASEFQYTILRLVPSVERGERINVGVVLFCRQRGFLAARIEVDVQRLATLAPSVDPAALIPHLNALCDIARGASAAGALGALSPSERFGLLAAPSSTMIQAAPVHTGLSENPEATLQRLFETLVAATPRA
jgi:Protein of unknown function (DUF3037)